MVRGRARPLFLLPFLLVLTAAMLVGVVDAFLPFGPAASYNINVKLSHHVPAAAGAAAGGKLLPLINELSACVSACAPAAGASMVVQPTQGARTSVPPSFRSAAALNSRCSRSSVSRVFCGAQGLLSLDDHDGGDQGGGRGKGGGNSGDGSGSGSGDSDESSAGGEGRDPLVLAGVGSGLGAALDGLKEALRSFRMPWARKVSVKDACLMNYFRVVWVCSAACTAHANGMQCWLRLLGLFPLQGVFLQEIQNCHTTYTCQVSFGSNTLLLLLPFPRHDHGFTLYSTVK